MNILGVYSIDVAGHPSACLLKDGKLIAFAEEERFIRVKRAKGYFPSYSIRYCLQEGGIGLDDVDFIAYGWDCNLYRFSFPVFLAKTFIQDRLFERHLHDIKPLNTSRKSLGSSIIEGIKALISLHPKSIYENIIIGLKDGGVTEERIPPVLYISHHLSHAASAFYCSGFPESAILVFDGHGEKCTVTIFHGNGKKIKPIKKIYVPNSLGWFYSLFTEYLGWNPNEGEVKLMGLAPFGKENPEVKKIVDEVLIINDNGIKLNTDYMFYSKRSYGGFYSDALISRFGPPRGKYEEITQKHKDIAFAVQKRMEEAGIYLAKLALDLTGSENLCIAGGVALNCKMNGEIHKAGIAKNIFVQPVSYDAGASLGAAMVTAMDKGDDCRFVMDHSFWGPGYTDEQIEAVLKRTGLKYRLSEDICVEGAKLIAAGKIIGWFQGRLEAGPRALGGRSILADPRDIRMKDKVNDLVKFRENWRPFALSLAEEYRDIYLKKPVKSPFMIMAFDVVDSKSKDIQGAMHWIDRTTRPQTVSRQANPLYWNLIEEFRKITGVPGILNTSFNVKGEAVVCSPEDALRCFYGTGMETLIMGNFIIDK